METEDVHAAWAIVAKKTGFRLCPQGRGKVTLRHVYRSERGTPEYVFMRYEDGSGSFSHYSGAFLKRGLGGKKRLLYNLPEVIAADTVLIVEGEKKADVVAALGLVDEAGKPVAATCTGGADSWRTEFVEYLAGKRILVLPDSDNPGRRYAASVQNSLSWAGIQHSIAGISATTAMMSAISLPIIVRMNCGSTSVVRGKAHQSSTPGCRKRTSASVCRNPQKGVDFENPHPILAWSVGWRPSPPSRST